MSWCLRSKIHLQLYYKKEHIWATYFSVGNAKHCLPETCTIKYHVLQHVQKMNMSTQFRFGRYGTRLHFPRFLDEAFLFFVAYQSHSKF